LKPAWGISTALLGWKMCEFLLKTWWCQCDVEEEGIVLWACAWFWHYFVVCSEIQNLKVETLEDQYIIVSSINILESLCQIGSSSLSSDCLSNYYTYSWFCRMQVEVESR
jgi:hypothetical protein